jgi:hypothetical protein
MKGPNSDWLVVEHPETAKALLDVQTQRFLEPFLGRSCTVTQAALELQVKPNALLYRVNQLLRLELLEVECEERRAGKPIKFYRSSAPAFFVPFALTPAETVEALILPLEREWGKRFAQNAAVLMSADSSALGLGIWRAESGEVIAKPRLPPPAPFDHSLFERWPVLSLWSVEVYLEDTDAAHLREEMLILLERYAAQGGSKRHIVHLGFAPWVLDK